MKPKQSITQTSREPACIITIGAKTHKENTASFETILTQVVDETFSQLGCKQNIYRELETKYTISPKSIPDNPDVFVAALKDMFGESSLLVELNIIQLLHSKTPKIKYRPRNLDEFTLCGYIKNLKASFS
jgi:hypothetical protein